MALADFSFAWEAAQGPGSPWGHLQVGRLRGREAISEPFRYELTVIAKTPAPEVEIDDLIGKRASLRIATQSSPMRKVVHGIIVEAEELFEAPDGMVYRLTVMPPWARAMHRKRCRIFLDKTLRQIVNAVLTGDPLMKLSEGAEVEDDDGSTTYSPAKEIFTWRVKDTSRLDDKRVRSYVVQYNESDFDFVARLLEEEGLSYHFENGDETSLLVITDNDGGRQRLSPIDLGAAIPGRNVKTLKLGARLRPSGVILDDYNWKKPSLDMASKASGAAGAGDLVEYGYPGGYPDAPAQGKPLATARLERYGVEASYAVGDGSVRVLSAGSVFKLHHDEADHEGEYLVTSLEVHGEQQGVLSLPSGIQDIPWAARFELARRGAATSVEESRFRPALRTPKPRIRGTHTAVVTADPSAGGAEVNVGGPDGISIGCVRVRFRWDTEKARLAKEPSSTWVRVSQIFAGAGEGGVFHPRVGDEVLVDFEEGDPDRPIVVGRVYNGANLPARNGAPDSSMKSLSTPGGGTYNEIMFGDSGGGELLHYFAGKDQTTDVANFRRESVASNATMTVGSNNTETIGANRTESIGGNDTLTVGANQAIFIGGNASLKIGGNFDHKVGASEVNTVGGSQTIKVGGNLTEDVGSVVLESYGASRKTTVGGAVTEDFGAAMTVTVGGNVTETCASHELGVSAARLMVVGGNYTSTIGGDNTENVGAVSILASAGPQTITVSGAIVREAPVHVTVSGYEEDIKDAFAEAKWTDSANNGITMSAIGIARAIKGISSTTTALKSIDKGYKNKQEPTAIKIWAVGMVASGVDLQAGGPQTDS